MRIAQVAPLAESVPPSLYGGTERVVSWLTEELMALQINFHAAGERRIRSGLCRKKIVQKKRERPAIYVGRIGRSANGRRVHVAGYRQKRERPTSYAAGYRQGPVYPTIWYRQREDKSA